MHGINPATGLPFYPPVDFRITLRPHGRRGDKDKLLQGRCSTCLAWVDIEGIRPGQVKVPEIYWWKHAQRCQGTYATMSTLEAVERLGVFDPDDELYQHLLGLVQRDGDPYAVELVERMEPIESDEA